MWTPSSRSPPPASNPDGPLHITAGATYWFQWDYGDGPLVCGEKSVLFCGWLAWCRFRLVFPLRDKRLGTVIAALDRSFRRLGGAPTYALTDNEKTVTERHIAALPVRNPKTPLLRAPTA